MEQILLECKNVSKRQGDFELKDINFQLPAGYIMGVIGRNGAGKSTLLNILLHHQHPKPRYFRCRTRANVYNP